MPKTFGGHSCFCLPWDPVDRPLFPTRPEAESEPDGYVFGVCENVFRIHILVYVIVPGGLRSGHIEAKRAICKAFVSPPPKCECARNNIRTNIVAWLHSESLTKYVSESCSA